MDFFRYIFISLPVKTGLEMVSPFKFTKIFNGMLFKKKKNMETNWNCLCKCILPSLFQPTAQTHSAKREATNARHHGVSNGNQDPTFTQSHGASSSWVSFIVLRECERQSVLVCFGKCVCVCVCVYVCVCVCMHWCECTCLKSVCMFVCVHALNCVCAFTVCVCVCMCVCVCVCVCVCMCVCE